jgi:hypothetical protein
MACQRTKFPFPSFSMTPELKGEPSKEEDDEEVIGRFWKVDSTYGF